MGITLPKFNIEGIEQNTKQALNSLLNAIKQQNDLIDVLQSSRSDNNPVGSIFQYGGSTAPTGYMMADGSAISRSNYINLFNIIGTTFGSGDGTTTFNLPDFRGVFPKGAGTTNRTLGKDANGNYYSGTLGTYLQDKIQGHIHQLKWDAHGGSSNDCVWTNTSRGANDGDAFYGNPINSPQSDGVNGTPRTGMTTEPQSLGINFIIKY